MTQSMEAARASLRAAAAHVQAMLPPGIGFAMFVFPPDISFTAYVANADRADVRVVGAAVGRGADRDLLEPGNALDDLAGHYSGGRFVGGRQIAQALRMTQGWPQR